MSSVDPDERVLSGPTCIVIIFAVFHSICIFWTNYPIVWPLCLNFWLLTAMFSSLWKFRNFTVFCILQVQTARMRRLFPTGRRKRYVSQDGYNLILNFLGLMFCKITFLFWLVHFESCQLFMIIILKLVL